MRIFDRGFALSSRHGRAEDEGHTIALPLMGREPELAVRDPDAIDLVAGAVTPGFSRGVGEPLMIAEFRQ
jgi:hypothetical protein